MYFTKSYHNSNFSPQVTTECEQRMVGDHLPVLHSECKPMVSKEMRSGTQICIYVHILQFKKLLTVI